MHLLLLVSQLVRIRFHVEKVLNGIEYLFPYARRLLLMQMLFDELCSVCLVEWVVLRRLKI